LPVVQPQELLAGSMLVVDDGNWDLNMDTNWGEILVPTHAAKKWTPLREDCESRQLEKRELSP
jgi:hypothetical protein